MVSSLIKLNYVPFEHSSQEEMAFSEDDLPHSPTEKFIPAPGKGTACIPGLMVRKRMLAEGQPHASKTVVSK